MSETAFPINETTLHCISKVLEFFGNREKAILWFKTPNPGLGNISPNEMIKIGRAKKLKRFIDDCLEENLP